MTKRHTGIGILFAILLWSGMAAAAEASAEVRVTTGGGEGESTADDDGYLSDDKAVEEEENKPMWLGLGIRAGGGGNILLKPDGVSDIPDIGGAPFRKGGGDLAGGGGAFIEARWLKGHLGLEVGVWNERNRTWTTQSMDDPFTGASVGNNKFIYYYSVVHFPLLLEAHILKKNHRVSFGLGPEFTIGLASTDVKIQSDVVNSDNVRVKRTNDVLGAFNIGWGVKFGDWVVGLDLKTTYNFTQPRDYSDRVSPRSGGFQVLGSHTIDFRLAVNLMYEIGLPR